MMKAAVFSDTHSNTALMVEAVARCRPDLIIHLGDHSRDTAILREKFPEIPLYSVRGNCDISSDAPDTDIVPLGPVKAFICHGHTYGVEYGRLDSLVPRRRPGRRLPCSATRTRRITARRAASSSSTPARPEKAAR